MTAQVRKLSFIWLAIAVALELASTLGGDASKLWGWILLLWTAPFSVIYQFLLYDVVLGATGRSAAQAVGALFETGLGYLLWFVILPRVSRRQSGAAV
jgi:hypothetical protein